MLKTGTKSRDIDESQLSHTKYNCLYHIVFIQSSLNQIYIMDLYVLNLISFHYYFQ